MDNIEGTVTAAPKWPNFSAEFRRMIVEMTLQLGASVVRIAREHNLNDNMVLKRRRRYRDAESKAKGLPGDAAVIGHRTAAPVNVIDAGAGQSTVEACGAVSASCEVEIEVGKRRVRIRGLSMDRAEHSLTAKVETVLQKDPFLWSTSRASRNLTDS